MITKGNKIPNFSLPATTNTTVSLDALKGKPFILYFYPKDDTSGCTAESCAFSENIAAFNRLGISVIGISKDSLASHEKFKKKYALAFELASDAESNVCEQFGVWVEKSMYGRKYFGIERTTYLVGADGTVVEAWHKVKVPGHIDAVLKAANNA